MPTWLRDSLIGKGTLATTKPWEKYKVAQPSGVASSYSNDCVPLKTVSHIAHVPTAIRISEDRKLRADLIFDKSKLNTRRIRVVWLSPNDWTGAGGFRYGNIRYNFDWETLIEGKNAYWVEDIAYGIPACRILITEVDRSRTLEPYDPINDRGPWWLSQSGEHYWNGDCCLEIMFEDDISIESATHVDFVKHHAVRCSVDYRTCYYGGTPAHTGGAEFIAALCGRQSEIDLPGLVESKLSRDKKLVASDDLVSAAGILLIRCRNLKISKWGRLKRSSKSSPALARAVLGALGSRSLREDAARLAKHFASLEELNGAIVDAIASAVGLPDASSLLED